MYIYIFYKKEVNGLEGQYINICAIVLIITKPCNGNSWKGVVSLRYYGLRFV